MIWKSNSKNIGMAKKLVQFPFPEQTFGQHNNFLTKIIPSTSKNEDGKTKWYNHFGKWKPQKF